MTSPPSDTDRIAYVSDREGVRDLWIMEADGSDPHPVLDNDARRAVEAAGGIGHPDWTDDGRIVFSSTTDLGRNEDQDQEIWGVNEDGTGVGQLPFNAEDDDTPDWTPDGGQIVWERAVATTTGDQHVAPVWRPPPPAG